MSDPTADLEAWNTRYDAAVEAGADPAEAVAQADKAVAPPRPRVLPRKAPPQPPWPSGIPTRIKPRVEDPEVVAKRLEFERWNAANEAQKARREAGIAHEQAVREARRWEFHEAQQEAANEKAKPKIVKHHRSLDEP